MNRSPRPRPLRRRCAPAAFRLAVVAALLATAPPPPAAAQEDPLAAPRRLIETERPAEAIAQLDRLIGRQPDNAEALLLRSTARLMEGDSAAGRRDLEKALAADPALRQAWLTLGGLAVAERSWDEALAAFHRAEALEPSAADNDVNIGAVELLAGDLEAASSRFARYLEGPGADANGYYLVAKNYALAGYEALTVEHLRRAIELDERARVQAKADPAFAEIKPGRRFQELLATNRFTPPEGFHVAERDFPEAYDGARGPLLHAVLDALQLAGRPFDRRVDVAPDWAVIWAEARIEVADSADGGRVELSAPPDRFTVAAWSAFSDELLRDVATRLALAAPREPIGDPSTP
ncbi:MAG TPA: tetratricopeptide repeat protein [Thermoanaerobaculia bacterium]|nr:tetratricopeptide repeat protein [Thermoanaerobaculia bacterium]